VAAYSESGAAISATGTGIIESTARSYIFVPGNSFVGEKYYGIRWYCLENGAVQIYREGVMGDRQIYIPITVPGVLYGQEVTLEHLTIYYNCEDGSKNYITGTYLNKQKPWSSDWDVILSHVVDKRSNSPDSYAVALTTNNVLSAHEGFLSLWLNLRFENETDYVQINGAKLCLSHS
jgi:hypothetical protein